MVSVVLTTAALFTAIIINDAIMNDSSSIPNHAFLGLIAVLATSYLSMKGAEMAAWGIITLPAFVILLSFVLAYMSSSNSSTSSTSSNTPIAPIDYVVPSTNAVNIPIHNSTACSSCLQNPIGKEIRLPLINPNVVTPNSPTCVSAPA
jgi:hypothetical protein